MPTRVAAGQTRTIANKTSTRQVPYGGPRMAQRAVDLLFRVLRYHASENGRTLPQPPRKWQEELEREWGQIVGTAPIIAKPRHTQTQIALMLKGLRRADPRLGLLLELAAEVRLGQARRCTRKDLDLAPGAGILGYGVLTIPGTGKKKGTIVDLTAEQRETVKHVLENGYLRDFEVYFQATRLRNYPLFPTGRFKKGLATEKQLRPVTKDGLRGWFQEYEQRLGIPHVSGRGWYGVRRTASDLAEDSVKDARALNLLTGHRGSQTRRGYQDPEHDEVRRLAVEARTSIRKRVQPVPKRVPKRKKPVQVRKKKRP